MINRCQDIVPRRAAQTKKIAATARAGDPQKFHHHSEPRHQRQRIRKIFQRILQPDEVRFLPSVWKAGAVRVDDCPDLAGSLERRGWLERDGRGVRLSAETRLLVAEGVEAMQRVRP